MCVLSPDISNIRRSRYSGRGKVERSVVSVRSFVSTLPFEPTTFDLEFLLVYGSRFMTSSPGTESQSHIGQRLVQNACVTATRVCTAASYEF